MTQASNWRVRLEWHNQTGLTSWDRMVSERAMGVAVCASTVANKP